MSRDDALMLVAAIVAAVVTMPLSWGALMGAGLLARRVPDALFDLVAIPGALVGFFGFGLLWWAIYEGALRLLHRAFSRRR